AGNTLSAKDEKFLKDVEIYVNSLKSIRGSFAQSSSNGVKDEGVFYIKKPGRMRLEYKSPMLLVADGTSIVYHDKKLNQISYIALDSNPASIILNGNVALTGANPSAKVKGIEEVGDTTELTLATKNEKQTGVITLVFQTFPLSLLGWKVKDAQGVTTKIILSGITPESSLADSLFKITKTRSFTNTKPVGRYY
ncbi:MAG: outer membrane lipoprotein carrier protein LolA, partial [Rickettsiales bacterium]|nr:outer membrane lipoprotein carrier protein LolA [Rickettsiales bacterium]